jgi:hypothetical protein
VVLGQVCPGNPTYCRGKLFYNEFRCEIDPSTLDSKWTSLAVPVCNADDAGFGPDGFASDDATGDASGFGAVDGGGAQ